MASAESTEQKWQISSNLHITQSNSAWRDQLAPIVDDGKVEFVAQPISNWSQNILYQKWFARFSQAGTTEYIYMNQLVPASIRLDYAQQLDEMVVTTALAK